MPDLQTILHHVPAALLVIFRIGGLTIYGPVLGSSVIPVRVKVMLSFMIGIMCYPLLSSDHFARLHFQDELWMLAPLVGMELIIGLIVGFLASLPLLALQTGGLIMGQQMGLGFAQLYNPAIDDEADIVGQMLFFMGLAAFVLVGGHESMLLSILHSFDRVPVGGFSPDGDLVHVVTGVLLASLELALRVAAPVLALVFLETVAMGFLAKTVPQLNILSLGFPIRILIGFASVGIGLVVINDVALESMSDTFNAVFQWIDSCGSN